MSYLKKSLIVFFPILISLFLVKGYIATNDFSNRLENILNSSGLNLEFDSVKLEKFNKLIVNNLKIKDMKNNTVIDAKEATASINLLMPSRLLRVDVNNAIVNLERSGDNHFNIFDVIKSEEKKNPPRDRASRIGRLYINNSTLNYTDVSYDKKILKTLENVNGYLETSKSRGFELEARGNSIDIKDEEIGIKLKNVVSNRQSLLSLFDTKKNDDESRKNYYIDFDFKNIKITEELGQYVPLDMIKVKDGILNGKLLIDNETKDKNSQVFGKLDVKNGTVFYNEYKDDIKNTNAIINLGKEVITVKANTTMENGTNTNGIVDFGLEYTKEQEKLKLKIDTKYIPYQEIAKYKALEDLNIKAIGNITGNIEIDVNTKTQETEINGKLSSPNINIADYNFRNAKSGIKMTKDKKFIFDDIVFHFDENIAGVKIKNDVEMKSFVFDTEAKNGKGDYVITNKGSDYSIKQIKGEFTLNDKNIINGTVLSENIDGNYQIDPIAQLVVINGTSKKDITVKYNNANYIINPKIDNLTLNFKKDSIVESGNIKTKIIMTNNNLIGPINANIKITNGTYNIDAIADISGQNVKITGTTTGDMIHSYKIDTAKNSSFDVAQLLRASGYDMRGLNKSKLPVTLTANIKGKGDVFTGDYEVYSPYGQFVVEYENLRAKGKIRNLLSLNLDVNAKMNELWLGYQRLKDVNANLDIKNNVVNILNVSNDKLMASGTYNLKNGYMKINSDLEDYIVYNTINPEIYTKVNKLTAKLNGTIDNLGGNITLEPAQTFINSHYIGNTIGNIEINNSVLNFKEVNLRENNVSGTYDLKTGLADISMHLDESDIPKLFKFNDLTFGTKSELYLKGDLNNFNLTGKLNLVNISFKDYKVPSILTTIDYQNGDIDRLFRYGTFNLEELAFVGDNNEKLFTTKTSLDLENMYIDYELENEKFTLDSVQDLKDKGYSGDIDLGFRLKGNLDNFESALRIKSDKITLSGFPVENLDVDIEADKNRITVGQFYLEYEKNPLLVNGYLGFGPVNYNMSVLVRDFNLEFLGVDKNIKNAGGLANIDIVFTDTETAGEILLNNFNYITKDGTTRAENINANISVDNRRLNINRFDGGYNGGTFKVGGDLEVPRIPENFMETKRLELGKFEVDAEINKIGVKYGEDIDLVLTGDVVFTENNLFGTINVDSGEIRAVPDIISGDTKTVSTEEQTRINRDKTIVEGIVEEIIDKVVNQYSMDISVQTSKDLKLNINSLSLAKSIRGGLVGTARIIHDSNEMGIIGDFSINKGSFILNGNRFTIENAEVRFLESDEELSNPFVVFTANTNINGERISVGMNGYVNDSNFTLSSDSGLTREQILSLLAFNTSTIASNQDNDFEKGNDTTTAEQNAAILGTVVDNTLNELLFSPITGKIKDTFGLTQFSISTDLESINSENQEERLNGYTVLTIQDNIYKDRLFWNAQVKIPMQNKEGISTTRYNIWTSYNVSERFGLKLGGETLNVMKKDGVSSRKSTKNYYFGIDFSSKAYGFNDLIKKTFKNRKLETLAK